MDKFVIIDGNNLLYRAFYALPLLTNFDGEYSNAVFGFTNMIVKIVKEIKPKYIAVAMDCDKKNFRHDLYKEYKGNRASAPEELAVQFPILNGLLEAMNITVVRTSGLEADDLIGCLSRQFDTENIIVTADKDCLQLINSNTLVMQPKKGVSETVMMDEAAFKAEWGILPNQIIDYKALRGDPSDNIPGVKGIGDKRAIDLLLKYGTVENVYKHLDELKDNLKQMLINGKDSCFMSKELATIITDKKVDFTLEDFTYEFPFNAEVLKYFKRYQFNSLLKKEGIFNKTDIEQVEKATKSDKKCEQKQLLAMQDLTDLVGQILKEKQVSIYVGSDCFSIYYNNIEYNGTFGGDLLNSGFDPEHVLLVLKPVFESNEIKKIVFDAKDLKHKLYKFGIALNNVSFDVVVGRYLINTGGKPNTTLQNVIDENLLNQEYFAFNLSVLTEVFLEKINKLGLQKVLYEIELPLTNVLFEMETAGFKIDVPQLSGLELKYEKELKEITDKIYELAGEKFNLNSPKQLGEILFDKLNLKAYNNKKKSTSGQVLEEIKDQHPIVSLILRFRQINKLYTTYVLAFKDLVDKKTQKIYTIFNQTLTTTGRLSSSEPNLQNIPVRTEEGKGIRKLFIPSTDNGFIVGADYSQIELRLLADFCGDERLIEAFNTGQDIHALTASEIFGVPIEDVTENMRRDAKAINFGIIYGISDYGLSQNIHTLVVVANDYIKRYFAKYPKIEGYMKNNVEMCRKNGHIKTMFGRVRNIPEINSSNYNLRQFGERAAMNMPLQGSASDIIKLSMIKVANEFKKHNLKSKLILQVHDELIVDTVAEELDIVKSILKDCMENVVDLKVKLEVNVEVGKNWFEA